MRRTPGGFCKAFGSGKATCRCFRTEQDLFTHGTAGGSEALLLASRSSAERPGSDTDLPCPRFPGFPKVGDERKPRRGRYLRRSWPATGVELLAFVPELQFELDDAVQIRWTSTVLAVRLGGRRDASVDRLLDAEEAARMLGVEKDSLWRRKWPFTVKVAAHTTRYSLNGIQKWIRERVGRKT